MHGHRNLKHICFSSYEQWTENTTASIEEYGQILSKFVIYFRETNYYCFKTKKFPFHSRDNNIKVVENFIESLHSNFCVA